MAGILAACGHDAGRPTLFLCEGLLVYLDRPTCVRLLTALRARAATGSVLAASLATHREELDSGQVLAVANARRRTGATEPWLTILPPAAHLRLLRESGWQADQAIDAAQFGTGAEPGRSLLAASRPVPS